MSFENTSVAIGCRLGRVDRGRLLADGRLLAQSDESWTRLAVDTAWRLGTRELVLRARPVAELRLRLMRLLLLLVIRLRLRLIPLLNKIRHHCTHSVSNL